MIAKACMSTERYQRCPKSGREVTRLPCTYQFQVYVATWNTEAALSAFQAFVVLSNRVIRTATSRKSHRLGPTRAMRRTNAVSARIAKSGRRAVSDWYIKNPAATRKIETPALPLRKKGRTAAWLSIQSTGHSCQPWDSTTSAIATPRSPSYRSIRRWASATLGMRSWKLP